MPIRTRSVGLWVLLVLASLMLDARRVSAADDVLVPTLRFKRVPDPPKGNTNDFAHDESGYLWVAGNEGLGRYDGYQFLHFAADGKPGSLNTPSALYADQKGSLWVGTDNGLERLDLATLKFERFQHDENDARTIGGKLVTRIIGGKDGTLWIGTDGGLSSLDPATKTITNYLDDADPKSTNPVRSLLEDKNGQLWIGTDTGIAKLDRKSNRVVHFTSAEEISPTSSPVTALLEHSTGIWVGTNEGLYHFDAATSSFKRSWPEQLRIITTLRMHRDGTTLLVGTREDGLFFADTTTERLVNHRPNPNRDDAIMNPYIVALHVDRGGVLWVGFNSGGVVKTDLATDGISYYATKPGLAYYEEPSGVVWVGHEGSGEGSGLRRFDPKTGKSQLFLQKEISGTWITRIVPDDEGWLWLSTSELGVYRYNPKSAELIHFSADEDNNELLRISNDSVYVMQFDPRSRRMWIGTNGGGLDAYDLRTNTFARYKDDDKPTSLTSDFVFAFHFDRKDPDVLWVGTGNGGLNRLQIAQGTFTSVQAPPKKDTPATPNQLSNNFVNSIHETADGTLWLGTYGGGLNRYDRKTSTVKVYRTTDGLPSNVIYGIMEDKSGALWLTTNSGLVKFEPKTGTSFTFTEADGIGQDEFAQGAYYQGPSGILYMGGPRGFNTIDPTKLKPSSYSGPIHVTGIRVYGEKRPMAGSGIPSFSYRDGVITLDFASLSFANPERIKYRYRLPPLYEEWIDANGPSITFTNLPGGKYNLQVQATNHHGVVSDKLLELPFHVDPPPWKTWWAFALYCLALLGLAFAVVRIQRARILTLQRRSRLDAVERDLELTGAVQTGFLPELNEITTPQLRVFGYYRPADACGGDWWWHEQLPGGRHVVLVGDVTGHGPGPAMVTAAVATAFRVLIENGLENTEQALHLLNREVLRVGRGRYHMTMAAIELEEATGRYIFFSAGAPPMLSLNQAGEHRVHFCPGAPLGTEGAGFEIGRLEGRLKPTERILVYTDGIPEIAMVDGRQLGMRRFAQLYERTRMQPVRDAAATILLHADQSRGNGPQLDDWTFTIIEWDAGDTELGYSQI